MSRAVKCDRCGTFFDVGDRRLEVRDARRIDGLECSRIETFDLCGRCADRFFRWMACRPADGGEE
ncbi:hypothetical protein GMI70_02930 [Eggerthellaceae bacterium zg-893]|nr:hypothetical protein [Eggerthellaceae bacterium zg-893]